MKIAILGYAGQGQSAYEYWNRDGNELTVCDSNAELGLPEGAASQLGPDYLKGLDKFDTLVRTPALHPRDIVAANPETPNILDKVTTNTNEFLAVCPTKNIIGVTGTKGKGTTSTLISRMLEAAGKKVHLGGNIGIPPLELLKNDIQADDWVVLELANFQLIDIKHSPGLAVCLMVAPEHQDWHTDVDEYVQAKQQLFRGQTAEDTAIFYSDNELSTKVVSASAAHKIPYFAEPGALIQNARVVIDGRQLCRTSELKLLGEHNWQNVCAAVTAVWQIAQDEQAISSALTNFTGLPFRIERRREVRGIAFYNDSFASAPDATEAAIASIPEKKVMILGGYERGLSLERLADTLKRHEQDIRKAVLIGQSAGRLSETFDAKGFHNYVHESARDMGAIVDHAMQFAQSGDAVVFSPGFASFDMFKNFEDRGNKFNEVVDNL